MSKIKYSHFLVKEGYFVPTADIKITSAIQPGVYQLKTDMANQIYFTPKEVNSDDFIPMPGMITNDILKEIEFFWKGSTKESFNKFGLIYKRGILMHGVPGTGKTSTIMQVIREVISKGGIAIYNSSPELFSSAMKALRDVQGNCPVVYVMEELDKYCSDPNLLSLLDGELQVENVLYIGTTNYLDRIPDNIKRRPSRFAKVIEVTKPTKEDRLTYFTAKGIGLSDSIINNLVEASKGFVIDQMKELLINTQVFGTPIKIATKTIKALQGASVGLKGSNEDDDYDDAFEGETINMKVKV